MNYEPHMSCALSLTNQNPLKGQRLGLLTQVATAKVNDDNLKQMLNRMFSFTAIYCFCKLVDFPNNSQAILLLFQ